MTTGWFCSTTPGASLRTGRNEVKRVLLVGSGPRPADSPKKLGFPQLRTAHFQRALESSPHAVRTVLLVPKVDQSTSPKTWAGTHQVQEEGPGWIEQVAELSQDAEVLVSAGPYNPGRLACLVAGHRPVWADIPGDPFAEHQALLWSNPNEGQNQQRLAARWEAALETLERADAMSVISEPQRAAVHGQLGLLGRLSGRQTSPQPSGHSRVWDLKGFLLL